MCTLLCVLAALSFRPVTWKGFFCLLWAVFGSWLMVASFNKGVLWSACEMRPDTNSTRTEALLVSLFRRCGVSRSWCWSSGGEAGTEGNLTEKGRPFRAQTVGLGVRKLGNQFGTMLFPTAGSVFMLRSRGGKWCQPAPLCATFPLSIYLYMDIRLQGNSYVGTKYGRFYNLISTH